MPPGDIPIDPNLITPDPTVTAAGINDLNNTLGATNNTLTNTNNLLTASKDVTGGVVSNLTSMADGLIKTTQTGGAFNAMTGRQVQQLSLLTSALLGTTEGLKGLAGIDTRGLNLFSDQVKSLMGNVANLSLPLKDVQMLAGKLGLPTAVLKMGEGALRSLVIEGLGKYAAKLGESVDSTILLQNAFLQTAAASGQLGNVMLQGRQGLINLNTLTATLNETLTNSAEATNISREQMIQYFTELNKIPDVSKQNIDVTTSLGTQMNMLTASTELARGTHQSFEDVMKDLTTAVMDYGEQGQGALLFSTRIFELSQKFHAPLSDVRNLLTETAGAFKDFGDNAESVANIFNQLFGSLRQTGLGIRATGEIIGDVTKGIANMTLAQRAFLSSQTGGPGGLMGGIQIERDIREGRTAQVFQRMRDVMQRQFGQIVTQQQATQNEAAAGEFIRQRQFIMSGPFGQMFGTGAQGEARATRFMEAIARPGGAGGLTPGDQLLHETMQTGVDLGERTHTAIQDINTTLKGVIAQGAVRTLVMTQQALTGATDNTVLAAQLTARARAAAGGGTSAASIFTSPTGTMTDRTNMFFQQGLAKLGESVRNLGATIDAGEAVLSDLFHHEAAVRQARVGEGGITSEAERRRILQDLHSREAAARTEITRMSASRASLASDMQAGRAIAATEAARAAATTRPHVAPGTHSPGTYTAAPGEPNVLPGGITVNMLCPECHKRAVGNYQAAAVTGGIPTQ